ncbi:MAG: hypothetical protein E6K95_02650 [Thaumarchaeota archaeon]|nr:MAG: hypothetical protein E6K95_02650 [Nitrososphaerota archaeon]
MKLFEYQAKELLKEYGIPIPRSELARNLTEAIAAFRRLPHPVVLKSQVLADLPPSWLRLLSRMRQRCTSR